MKCSGVRARPRWPRVLPGRVARPTLLGSRALPALPDVWSEARRTAFLLVSPLGIAGCVAGVLLQLPQVNPLDLWMLSGLGGTIALSALLVWLRRLQVEHALVFAYTLAAAYFVAMLGNQLNVNVGREERLSEAVFWFPVLYCVAFLAWDLPRAAVAAAIPYALTVLLTLSFVQVFAERGEWTTRLGSILLQFLLAQGVLIVLMTSFAFLKQRLTQVKTLVYMDFLTSLPNRRFVEEQVRAWDAAPEALYAVAMLDVDHFKRVNDLFGHHVGDHVLRELSLVSSRFARTGDLLARWGGEEFVVLLPQAREQDAARALERIRAAIEGHAFDEVGRVTASFGVAERLTGETFHDALKRADAALYEAKRAGRNQVVEASALERLPLGVAGNE